MSSASWVDRPSVASGSIHPSREHRNAASCYARDRVGPRVTSTVWRRGFSTLLPIARRRRINVLAPSVDSQRIRGLVRDRLLSRPEADELERLPAPARRMRVREHALAVLREERTILSSPALTELVNQVSDEVVGLGPIERLLRDPEVSEVVVNGADDVYVERRGRIERAEGLFFEGEEQVLHLIERIVAPLGLRVDESSPFVDARLQDGSRVNAIIPPLSLCGPVMTIRKFALRPFAPEDLIAAGSVTSAVMELLSICVRARMNIVVCGGTGSGKTT